MTCIVGLVTKDGCVLIGGDSAGVGGYSLTVRKDPKVFISGDFAYGFTSSFRMGSLIRYSFRAPDHDPRLDVDTYLNTAWIDAIRKTIETGGYMTKDKGEESGGVFLLGYRGRLFRIGGDFQIGEALVQYDACGCGEDIARGSLHSTLKLNLPLENKDEIAITTALEAAELHSAGVRAPFHMVRLPATGT